MPSKSAYECKGCSQRFDDSGKHLTSTKKCPKKYGRDEILKIFTHQLQILNEKILCESCEESFDPASIKSHLTAKRCKEYYEKKKRKLYFAEKRRRQ